MRKVAIIIQGTSNYVPEVKNAWKDFKKDLIFSTWVGNEDKYDEDDIVIFNNIPEYSGPFNFNFQKISTYNGLLKAKELGYTHAIKIRGDYLPTNAKKFIELMDFNKMNFLMWHYTSFLWIEYPTLKGYLGDHFSCGPIDYMIELWNININFCHSPEVILTWNYINKLKNKIKLNYLITNLNENNDIYYIKFNNTAPHTFAHNIINTNFGERELYGRYESVFKCRREYIMTSEETEKFMTNDYLNFLRFFTPLPHITIFGFDIDLDNIIYSRNKLNLTINIDDIKEYIILSNNIKNNTTLIIEYFKKINKMYSSTITYESNPGNIEEKMLLLTKDEFMKKIK